MPCSAIRRVRGECTRCEVGDHVRAAAGEPVRICERHERARIIRRAIDDDLVDGARDFVHLAVGLNRADKLFRGRAGRDVRQTLQQSRNVTTLMIFVHDRVQPGANVLLFRRGVLRDHFEIYRERSGGASVIR